MASVMASLRCHIVMSGVVKFCVGLVIGFWLGVYFLSILIAEKDLDSESIAALSDSVLRRGTSVQGSPGSDDLQWGDGVVMVNTDRIWLGGKVALGPDYRLYLAPKYVETGPRFQAIMAQSLQIGPIRAFANLLTRLNCNNGVLEK